MKNSFILLTFCILGLTFADITPVPNFEVGLLAQGSGGIYVDWYLQSIYDPTGRDWNEIACATTGFLYGDTYGIMINVSEALTSTDGGVSDETKIYYDMNEQAVFYHDEDHTQKAFIVANYSFVFVEGEELDQVIIAIPVENNDYIVMAYSPSFVIGKWHYDITDWLKDHGFNPVEGQNYFHPEDFCFYFAPSTAILFKHPTQIIGDWYVTATSDVRQRFDWADSKCSTLSFTRNTTTNLYSLNAKIDNQEYGPYSLINDPQNITLFVGYYFNDWNVADDLLLEVFYADALGNLGVISQEVCWGAIINKDNKPVSDAIFKAFQVYLNQYSAKFCPGYDPSTPIKLDNTGCGSEYEIFE